MKIKCPHCSETIRADAQAPAPGGPALSCPACGKPAAVPGGAAADTRRPLMRAFLGLNRNARILGGVTLLTLGGLGIFLAVRRSGVTHNERERIHNQTINNEFFSGLAAGGRRVEEALARVEGLRPYGPGFIGLSRERLSWEEAGALAEEAGGEVLDVAVTAADSVRGLTGLLAESWPERRGETLWVLGKGRTGVMDSPDVLEAGDREGARRVFLHWPKTGNWKNQGWSWRIAARFDEVRPFAPCGLAAVRTGKGWGVINEEGKEVQPPVFDEIGEFGGNGCARVRQGEKWGMLDRSGQLTGRAEWDEVQELIHGMLPVRRDGKWGYLNAAGKLAVPWVWEDAWRFSAEGFAVVTRAGKRGIIDRTGKVIIEPVWDGAVNFCAEGLGMVRRGEGWGLVNTAGQLLCEPVWRTEWKNRRFDLGFLPVWRTETEKPAATAAAAGGGEAGVNPFEEEDGGGKDKQAGRRWSLLGMDGKLIPSAGGTRLYSPGAATFLKMDSGELGFPGPGGKVLFSIKGTVRGMDRGLLLIQSLDGKQTGLISQKGEWIKPMGPDKILGGGDPNSIFREGFARIASGADGKQGFIDRTGKTVTGMVWDEAGDFHEGLATVKKDGRWGYIDRSGRVVIQPVWRSAEPFSEGLAAVRSYENEEIPEGVMLLRGMRAQNPVFVRRWEKLTPEERKGMYKVAADFENSRRVWQVIGRDGKLAFGGKAWRLTGMRRFMEGYTNALGDDGRQLRVDRNGREWRTVRGARWLPAGLELVRGRERGPYLNRHGGAQAADLTDAAGGVVLAQAGGRLDLTGDLIPHAEPPRFGLMNAAGTVLREPVWDGARILSPSRVWFLTGTKCGLADQAGKVVIEPKWDELEILAVNSGSLGEDGKRVLIGRGGESILSPWVRVRDGEKTLILRPDGQPAIPETLTGAEYVDFYGPSRIAITQPAGGNGRVWSLYEPATGKQVKFPRARTFRWNWNTATAGVLWMQDNTTLEWRLMSQDGADLGHGQPEPEKPDGWGFVEERGLLHKPDGWMFVDTAIRSLSPERWEEARDFSEGLAAVRREGKWGYIGTDGRLVIPCVWERAQDFSLGLGAVLRDGRWGYLNPKGVQVIEPVWDSAGAFNPWDGEPAADGTRAVMEVAEVGIEGFRAVIGRDGAPVAGPEPGFPWNGHGLKDGEDELILMRRGSKTETVKRIPVRWPRREASPARFWQPAGGSGSGSGRTGDWTLQDETGKALTGPEWGAPGDDYSEDPFAGGLLRAWAKNGDCGLIRRDGTPVTDPRFDRIFWIAPGVAAVWARDSGGLMDTAGKWIFRNNSRMKIARFPRFISRKEDQPFRHGLVVIEDIPRWGYARLNR